jgi:hypothetical protein
MCPRLASSPDELFKPPKPLAKPPARPWPVQIVWIAFAVAFTVIVGTLAVALGCGFIVTWAKIVWNVKLTVGESLASCGLLASGAVLVFFGTRLAMSSMYTAVSLMVKK